ncbi:MAG TPA: hypothetical protein VLH77_07300 [Gammaproteobacteria bacterium]|nr:hypothetical protein [Gammaproteobacteria bacterium]
MKKLITLLLCSLALPAYAAVDGKSVAIGAGIGAVGAVILNYTLIPWISGKNEERERERQELERQRQIEVSKSALARIQGKFSREVGLLDREEHLSKKQLVEIVTGKFGNQECMFSTYDQEVVYAIRELEGINAQLLGTADQEKQSELLRKLRLLNHDKNSLLRSELTSDIEKERKLEREHALFDAQMGNEARLREVVKEVKGVVHAQNNNRSWTEEKLNNIANRMGQEGQAIRDMLRDEARRDEHRWDRQERHWERLGNHHHQNQNPPPYAPVR